MRVVVADSSLCAREHSVHLLRQHALYQQIRLSVAAVNSAVELIDLLADPVAPEIIVADTSLMSLDGTPLVWSLRQRGFGGGLVVTSSDKLSALPAFDVEAQGFALKHASTYEVKLIRAVSQAHFYVQHLFPHKVVLHGTDCDVVVDREEVSHLTAHLHATQLHWGSAQYSAEVQLDLADTQHLLGEEHFLRCHRSCVVNCGWVVRLANNELILAGGIHVPIGRCYYDAVYARLEPYLTKSRSPTTAEAGQAPSDESIFPRQMWELATTSAVLPTRFPDASASVFAASVMV